MIEYKVKVYENGGQEWYNINDQLHRADGPALECADGSKEWFTNGQRHRLDGPAVDSADGSKHWYKNGQRHREDGPAVEYPNGRKSWYLHGVRLSEAEFRAKFSPKSCVENKIVEIDGKKYRLVEAN